MILTVLARHATVEEFKPSTRHAGGNLTTPPRSTSLPSLWVHRRVTEVLDRLLTVDPENAEAHYLLGQNLLRAGKTQEAIEHWESAFVCT